VRAAVNAQPAEFDVRLALARLALAAPQDGLNSEEQFAHAERLDDVVVGAELEADDPVDLFALCGKHHHGNAARRRAFLELLAHLRSRHVREHQVEQHEIGPLLASKLEPLGTELGHDGVMAGLLEVVSEDLLEVLLVFDH
jgi:hypothetical protein